MMSIISCTLHYVLLRW